MTPVRSLARTAALAAGALAWPACAPPPPPRIACVVGGEVGIPAVRLAVEAINAAGGIRGQRLEVVVVPDAQVGSAAVAEAEAVVRDPAILGVVGHASSASSVAGAPVYNRAGLVQIAPTSSAPSYADAGPFSFRLIPDDRSQARFLARQIAGGPGRRIAVVYRNDEYGRGLEVELARALRALDRELVAELPLEPQPDSTDGALALQMLAHARADALVWIGQPEPLATLAPALRARLPRLRLFASDAFDAPFTYEQARPQLDGLRFVRFLDPQADEPRLRELRARFRAVTGRELTYEAVFDYDAVMLLAQALRAGAGSREEVRRYLVGLRPPGYAGVGGAISFDARGDNRREYRLAQIGPAGVREVPAQ